MQTDAFGCAVIDCHEDEGRSVFLSMFDLPSVARVFCPPGPRRGPPAASVVPVHPRACGERAFEERQIWGYDDSSPRVRGTGPLRGTVASL